MSFLTGLLSSVLEWGLTKLYSFLAALATAFIEKKKDESAVVKNETGLQTAIKTGDANAIAKAGEDSLNNIGGS